MSITILPLSSPKIKNKRTYFCETWYCGLNNKMYPSVYRFIELNSYNFLEMYMTLVMYSFHQTSQFDRTRFTFVLIVSL
jgi:hypothetical protein